MFSTEEAHALFTSLENLLCLKILYDCGYEIKSTSQWIGEYGSYSNETGFDIFVDSINILFTSCSDIEEIDGVYCSYRIFVHDTNLQRLIDNKSSEDQEKFIRPFQQTYCDYTDSEMAISLNEKGFRLELHEPPLCYSNFIETLIELRQKIDELCSLM